MICLASLLLLAAGAPALFAQSTNMTFITAESRLTNTEAGGDCVLVYEYSPTNMTFDAVRTSGPDIIQTPVISHSNNYTRIVITVTPKNNKSGTIELKTTGMAGAYSTNDYKTLKFLQHPPVINAISSQSVNEDGAKTITLGVSDPDTALDGLTVSATSGNTSLIDGSGLAATFAAGAWTLKMTPKPNQHGSAQITVTVADPDNLTASRSFQLTVNSVPDAPVLTTTSPVLTNDKTGFFTPFSAATVNDADHSIPAGYNEILTLTVTLPNDTLATFESGATSFTASGTPGQIQTILRNIKVYPVERAQNPGNIPSLFSTIVVRGAVDNLAATNSVELRIEMLNSPPSLSLKTTLDTMTEGDAVQPFLLEGISDFDYGDDEFTLVASLADPAQAYLGSLSNTNVLYGTVINLIPLIGGLSFSSTPNTLTAPSVDVAFEFVLTDGHGGRDVVTNTITILQAQTPPSISGIPVATIEKTDADAAFILLPDVFVTDPDVGGQQWVEATITLSNPSLGTLSKTSFISQPAANLVSALRAVAFQPARGAVPPWASATTAVILAVTDSSGISTQNNNLSIRITGVNNAPQILNVPPLASQPLLIPPSPPILPFTGLDISHDDSGDIFFTIALDNPAKGTLVNLGGFSLADPGVYTMTGTASAVIASLHSLEYILDSAYLFPVDGPGGTTFTLTARDTARLTSSRNLSIQVQLTPRNHIVTRSINDGQPGSLTFALANADNNDVITFALPEYPATIRMQGAGTTELLRNLSIKGPGQDLLTISGDGNGDDTPDRQIFSIRSRVTIEGVTLSHGKAAMGGAISVKPAGELILRSSAIVHSTAAEFGGAIDVEGGRLTIENSFIGFNSVSAADGQGGGGVSIYSNHGARISNTTFHGNTQANEAGIGGGAVYFQIESSSALKTYADVTHSTFAGNSDASGSASAILCVDNNAILRPANSIFADFSGRNLNVYGGGDFESMGGNFCDDSTKVVRTTAEGSSPYLLDNLYDHPETNPLLAPLTASGAVTPHHQPQSGSPAIGAAINSTVSIDQLDAVRDAAPDSGAVEYDALRRLVINEIQHSDGTLNFIEITAPRDGAPIDLATYSLFVDGVKAHSFAQGKIVGTNTLFTSGTPATTAGTLVNPGFAVVVAFTNGPLALTSPINPTPVYGASETNSPVKSLNTRGQVSIAANASAAPIARQSWAGIFVDPATGTNDLDTAGQSIALAPQFRGFALLPHAAILPGPFEGANLALPFAGMGQSPGADVIGTPFGQPNAEPLARDDLFTMTEDEAVLLDAMGNDYDGDGNDRLIIVNIGTTSNPGADVGATNSLHGAEVRVEPDTLPLRGNNISFDPRLSATLQQLPVGVEIIDEFHYEIIDVGHAAIEAYGNTGSNVLVTSTNHRLASGEEITISGSGTTAYNGSFIVTVVSDNAFEIPVAFAGQTFGALGTWETMLPRLPTNRSEGRVNVRVIGRNDPPVATADVITNVTEETTLRIMVRPEFTGQHIVFPGDPTPAPELSVQNLLANDHDIDSDDTWSTLAITGILGDVNPIAAFSAAPGGLSVTVNSPAHGLATGTEILIANYGGHPSYNGYHVATVINDDSFSIPVSYVDDNTQKGVWAILDDSNRLQARTAAGVPVALTIRADACENNLVYRAGDSAFLDGLSEGERYDDTFWYAIEDGHGAIGIGQVTVEITGVNDDPIPSDDPGGLEILAPIVTPATTLEQILASGLDLMYTLPAASGASGKTDLHALDLGGTLPGTLVLRGFFTTDEKTPLAIPAAELLANDDDADRLDTLTVDSVAPLSREEAAVSLAPAAVTYDPTASTNLKALARGEMRIDTFTATVTDSKGGSVDSLVAVLVIGVNDTPTAVDDMRTTNEDEILAFDPRVNDIELDINRAVPDDRLAIIAEADVSNPGFAQVGHSATNTTHDATVSALLNQLADWQVFTNTFGYTVTDNSFLFAVDDEFHIPADSPAVLLNVLANDRDFTDSPVAPITIIDAGPALHGGSVSVVSNGQFIAYQPPAAFIGEDTFRYIIGNSAGDFRSGVVLVRAVVPPFNGVLHASADHFTAAAGETATLDVLANDGMMPTGSVGLQISELVCTSIPGQPRLEGNSFVFDATNGAESLTFTYAVTAGGASTSRADVAVSIIDRSNTLYIADDSFSILPGSFENVLNVLANDGLVGEPTAHYRIASIVDTASHGTLAINADGRSLVYTPNPVFIGVERIRYIVSDQAGGTGLGQVAIVVGRNIAVNDFFKLEAADTHAVAINVLSNDRTLPNPSGTLIIQSFPPDTTPVGSLALGPGGSLLFTSSGTVGEANFNYVVADASNPARLSTGVVSVVTVASGTYANPDLYRVRGGGADYELDVLANDRSFPSLNRTRTITAIGTGANAPSAGGNVVIQGGKLIYTPAAGFFGNESFTYTMSDSVETDIAEVTVSVVRGDLFANPDEFTVFYENLGTANRAFTLPVTLNDSILPSMDQTFQIVDLGIGANAPSAGGSVQIAADKQSIVYIPAATPSPEYIEQFTYEIADSAGRRSAARVRVRVVNRGNQLSAITQDDAFAVARNSLHNMLPVLANDHVLPGDALGWTITGVSQTTSAGGSAAIQGSAVRYSPRTNFVGVDTFTYTVSDGLGATGIATARVRVGDMPTVRSRFVALAGSISNAFDVIANDALTPDYESEYALESVFGATAAGGVALGAGGVALYTPDPACAGPFPYTEHFFYTVLDDSAIASTGEVEIAVHDPETGRSTGTITLVVEGRNDPPEIHNATTNAPITDKDSAVVFGDVTVVEYDQQLQEPIDVTVSIDDSVKGALSDLGVFTGIGGGMYALSNTTAAAATDAIRLLRYIPVENRIAVPTNEVVTFTITVSDRKAPPVSDMLTTLDVWSVNDAPLISGTEAEQRFFYKLHVKPFAAVDITEVDDLTLQPLSITVTIAQPSQGTMQNLGDFKSLGNGIYRATNITAAAATQQLNDLDFEYAGPEPAASPAGITTHLGLQVDDGFAPTVVDTVTSVIAMQSLVGVIDSAGTSTGGSFGQSVDISSEFAVIGAPNADTLGENAGAAYIYRLEPGSTNKWTQWRRLEPATVTAGNRFGRSVAITEDFLAVGTSEQVPVAGQTGAVYIYRRQEGGADNWGEWMRLTPTNLTGSSRFGYSVAMHGDLLAVGAPDATLPGGAASAGAVLLFKRHQGGSNAWGEIMRWSPYGAGADGADFGWSVALSDDTLVVGAPKYNGDTTTLGREGRVFHFQRDEGGSNAWGIAQSIPGAGATTDDFDFGWSVAIGDGCLAVGAPPTTVGSVKTAGCVFLYERASSTNDFFYKQYIDRLSDSGAERLFGYSVAVDGERLLVGAPLNATIPNLGAAFLFEKRSGNWVPVDKLVRPAGSTANLFGRAVAMHGGNGIVGAPGSSHGTTTATDQGHAYFYRFDYTAPAPNAGLTLRQLWEKLYFGDEVDNPWNIGTLWGGTADPDGDGLSNDQEYAFAGDPVVIGNPDADTGLIYISIDDSGNWVLEYERRSNDPAIVFTLEASADLQTWSDWSSVILSETAAPCTQESEWTKIVLEPVPSNDKLFFRIKATW